MQRLGVILAILAFSGTGLAIAQPNAAPEILQPQDQIELAIGESRTLQFREPFEKAGTGTEGIAQIVPQSDRTLTVSGITSGQTSFYVQGPKGDLVYLATVIVAPAAGHLVKLYGRSDIKDFVGYYCSEIGCGRADLDKTLANGGRDPSEPVSQSVTVRQPTEGGGFTEKTKVYGR